MWRAIRQDGWMVRRMEKNGEKLPENWEKEGKQYESKQRGQ